ncbi:g9603 [Coccomyxa viridis]|uniref:G9603 protein n=1 Tax=Coccomyxa viridis TaxID=1274662 RepID=A0ABP1G5W1_9CHLO
MCPDGLPSIATQGTKRVRGHSLGYWNAGDACPGSGRDALLHDLSRSWMRSLGLSLSGIAQPSAESLLLILLATGEEAHTLSVLHSKADGKGLKAELGSGQISAGA